MENCKCIKCKNKYIVFVFIQFACTKYERIFYDGGTLKRALPWLHDYVFAKMTPETECKFNSVGVCVIRSLSWFWDKVGWRRLDLRWEIRIWWKNLNIKNSALPLWHTFRIVHPAIHFVIRHELICIAVKVASYFAFTIAKSVCKCSFSVYRIFVTQFPGGKWKIS